MSRRTGISCALFVAIVLGSTVTQAQSAYPTPPRSLPDSEEIALAITAAPLEISAGADVWAMRDGLALKIRKGTNGCACMVARDLHQGSLYPICFDQEAARTTLFRELKEVSLRSLGKSEDEVKLAVAAAYTSGELRTPAKPAMAYMMSSKQVLFSSPDAKGVRVGAWHPHVMIVMPYATPQQFGLAAQSKVDVISLDHEGTPSAELIVKVPAWADKPAAAAPHP